MLLKHYTFLYWEKIAIANRQQSVIDVGLSFLQCCAGTEFVVCAGIWSLLLWPLAEFELSCTYACLSAGPFPWASIQPFEVRIRGAGGKAALVYSVIYVHTIKYWVRSQKQFNTWPMKSVLCFGIHFTCPWIGMLKCLFKIGVRPVVSDNDGDLF